MAVKLSARKVTGLEGLASGDSSRIDSAMRDFPSKCAEHGSFDSVCSGPGHQTNNVQESGAEAMIRQRCRVSDKGSGVSGVKDWIAR